LHELLDTDVKMGNNSSLLKKQLTKTGLIKWLSVAMTLNMEDLTDDGLLSCIVVSVDKTSRPALSVLVKRLSFPVSRSIVENEIKIRAELADKLRRECDRLGQEFKWDHVKGTNYSAPLPSELEKQTLGQTQRPSRFSHAFNNAQYRDEYLGRRRYTLDDNLYSDDNSYNPWK